LTQFHKKIILKGSYLTNTIYSLVTGRPSTVVVGRLTIAEVDAIDVNSGFKQLAVDNYIYLYFARKAAQPWTTLISIMCCRHNLCCHLL